MRAAIATLALALPFLGGGCLVWTGYSDGVADAVDPGDGVTPDPHDATPPRDAAPVSVADAGVAVDAMAPDLPAPVVCVFDQDDFDDGCVFRP